MVAIGITNNIEIIKRVDEADTAVQIIEIDSRSDWFVLLRKPFESDPASPSSRKREKRQPVSHW